MGLEELQRKFELALEEFNLVSQKRGFSQNSVTCNDYGVFIDFAGVEVNYSLYSLEDNLEDYITKQAERHKIYLRLLKENILLTKKELQIFDNPVYSFVLRFLKPPQEELENILDQATIKVAFDKVLQEGALLGKYFFEEIAVTYTKDRFDGLRQNLVIYNEGIHLKAKELESLNMDKLQYFKNKNVLWYAKHS